MDATVAAPQLPIASFSSPCRISRTRSTPACPNEPNPHRNGRPIPTALAPRASALNTSVPRRILRPRTPGSGCSLQRRLREELGLSTRRVSVDLPP